MGNRQDHAEDQFSHSVQSSSSLHTQHHNNNFHNSLTQPNSGNGNPDPDDPPTISMSGEQPHGRHMNVPPLTLRPPSESSSDSEEDPQGGITIDGGKKQSKKKRGFNFSPRLLKSDKKGTNA